MSVDHGGPDYLVADKGRAVRMPVQTFTILKVAIRQTGGAYSLFELAVEAGGGQDPHIQHREDECLYVLSGVFEFVVEDETVLAGPGATIYLPKGTLHGFENVGGATGRLLAIHTPGGSHESFVEQVAAASGSEEAITAIAAMHGIEMRRT